MFKHVISIKDFSRKDIDLVLDQADKMLEMGDGDPLIGTNFIDTLERFEKDDETKAVVLIGEIGGSDEEEAADFITTKVSKPVVAFVAGQTAPPGKRMGHAGAIVSGGSGTAAEKIEAFRKAGVSVARIPSEITGLLRESAPSLSQ